MRLGCHPYVFSQYGYDQVTDFDKIWDMIAACGYPSIELHAPMLDRPDWYDAIMRAVERTGLEITGGSNGGKLRDIAEFDSLRETMDIYSEKLGRLNAPNCGFSAMGKRPAEPTDEDDEQVVRAWTELGQICQSHGVKLNYHTHGEPPADVQFVADNVDPAVLALGPDLDWLRVGGSDPETFLRQNASRLVMLHIRDYHLGGSRTFALGEGDANYPHLREVLAEIGFDGDFVVELAAPSGVPVDRDLQEILQISRDHLRETMGL
ncbi:MAG: sugar phosphate isomerase/epimerase family protein [Armatimonadota bacterium]